MKKLANGILVIGVLLMSFCNICYAATFQPVITAENGSVGDMVNVTVSLPTNTNAAGGSFNLIYDNTKMELVDATAGDIIIAFTKTVNKTYAENKIRLNFAGSEAVSSSGGVVLNATFKLIASGTATISTEKFKLADIDTNYLNCGNSTQSITITEEILVGFTPMIFAENGSVGDTIRVSVSIPTNTNAAGGSFNLVYDNTKMELIDAVAGDIITAFTKTVNKTYAENKIRLNFAGSEAVSSSGGVVLNATFKLIASGTATISTEKFKLADIDTNYLECGNSKGKIVITDYENHIELNLTDGVNVSANLFGETEEGFVCAVLSKNGKAKEIKFYSPSNTVQIDFEATETGDTLEAFWWKNSMAPMCESCNIKLTY